MLDSLGGPAVRRWMRVSWRGLGRERAEIDALNVFPVADSDTGTNLHLTVEAVVATSGPDDTVGEAGAAAAVAVVARAALKGARGNSGLILAQYLRGLAQGLEQASGGRPDAEADGPALALAFAAAAEEARIAVAAPVAGTILSVADAAADAARSACVVGVDDLAAVAGAAASGARSALARTPSQLAVLAAAGVVDAGGRGLVVVLDALVATIADADTEAEPHRGEHQRRPGDVDPPHDEVVGAHTATAGGQLEVMYSLETDDAGAAALRERLHELGDSVVVSGGDGLWAVHVHLTEAGSAVDAGLAAGTVSAVRITPLPPAAAEPSGRAVLVLVPGEGLATLLTDAGATVVPAVRGVPSAHELLAHVRAAHVGEVVLLPSGASALDVSETVARLAGRDADPIRARVVPTRAVVQSLAALAVHDPARDLDEAVVAMTAAAVSTRYGALTHAVRAAFTSAGRCEPGDVLGLVGEDVVTFGTDTDVIADDVVGRLLAAGGEMVTLVSGASAAPGFLDALCMRISRAHPGVEVVAYDGGQPDHPLLVGVE